MNSVPASVGMDLLETRLRAFRTRELANRRRPGPLIVGVDMAARIVPQLAAYAVVVGTAFPYNLIGAAIFAVLTVSMLGSWFHDGVHKIIPAPRAIAVMVQRLGSSPIGFSPMWWLIKHVRLHHRFPGNPEFDPDIQIDYVARVSLRQRWRPIHATQHIHMWFLFPLATLNMLKPNEPMLIRKYGDLIGLDSRPPTWILLADKYVPIAIVWVPVLLVQRLGPGLATFITFHLVAGLMASFVTQIQHNTVVSERGDPDRWPLCDQVFGAADVGHRRGVWWWLCGGVNFHVVHHLAPSLTFLELPGATARLRKDLAEIGMTIPTHRGLLAALRSHGALLRQLGRDQSADSVQSRKEAQLVD